MATTTISSHDQPKKILQTLRYSIDPLAQKQLPTLYTHASTCNSTRLRSHRDSTQKHATASRHFTRAYSFIDKKKTPPTPSPHNMYHSHLSGLHMHERRCHKNHNIKIELNKLRSLQTAPKVSHSFIMRPHPFGRVPPSPIFH